MDVDSKVREQAIKHILEDTKSRLSEVFCGHSGLSDQEWESEYPCFLGSWAVVLAEDLAEDETKKQAIKEMLPYLPRDITWCVLKAKGLERVRERLQKATPEKSSQEKFQRFWDTLPPGVFPMIACMAHGLGEVDSGVREGGVASDLLEDSELFMLALPGIESAKVIRCELTDMETGEKAECFLFAHVVLGELLDLLVQRYYREIFHLKEWRLRKMRSKYVPYVRWYGMLKSLLVSEERLKEIRHQLWLQYWDEYQERYGERYGQTRERERRAFNREVERKSRLVVKRWERLPAAERQRFVEEWAKEEPGLRSLF